MSGNKAPKDKKLKIVWGLVKKHPFECLMVITAIFAAGAAFMSYRTSDAQLEILKSGTHFEIFLDKEWTLKVVQLSGERYIIRQITVTGADSKDKEYKAREIDMLPYLRNDESIWLYKIEALNKVYCRLAGCRSDDLKSVELSYRVYDKVRGGLFFPQ